MLFGLLPAFTLADPTLTTRQGPGLGDIAAAQNLWAHDTSIVSQFLDAAARLDLKDLLAQA
jgi:hypothetical protein